MGNIAVCRFYSLSDTDRRHRTDCTDEGPRDIKKKAEPVFPVGPFDGSSIFYRIPPAVCSGISLPLSHGQGGAVNKRSYQIKAV